MHFPLRCVRLAAPVALLLAAQAGAAPHCPVLSCGSGDDYVIQVGLSGDDCETEVLRCTSARVSPPTARIDCHADGSGHACEAWPQGEGLAYAWFVDGALLLLEPASGSSPLQLVACDGSAGSDGVLSVEVVSPFGLSASAQVHLSCP